MKKYTKPAVKAIAIQANEIMAASLDTPNNKVGNGRQLGKGNILWDDDEEE